MNQAKMQEFEAIDQLPVEAQLTIFGHVRERFALNTKAHRHLQAEANLIDPPAFESVAGGEYETIIPI